jgi:dethiobiotin synthetase
MSRIIVITGTDTGAGKTVFTAALARWLHTQGVRVAALKPLCSGGRDDARQLRAATENVLPLDTVNPWHFRAALAPSLAARREGARVELREVIAHIHSVSRHFPVTLVEGAGGLLSPLGEGFSTRELIAAIAAEVIVVARNQLGVVNHSRLTFEALPRLISPRARLVLMQPLRADMASRTNLELLSEFIDRERISTFPRLRRVRDLDRVLAHEEVAAALERIAPRLSMV